LEMLKASVNGTEIAYQRSGSGTALVLLHGYPLDHTTWEPVLPFLQGVEDLILPDLRGFGASPSPQAGYSLADMAADIAALLDHLKIEQAVIAGHSMGGYIGLAFAHAFPERIRGLGLIASQAVADSPEGRNDRYATADLVRQQGVSVVADSMPARLTSNPTLQPLLREIILRQSPQGIIAALEAMAARPDSTPDLSGYNFPVVILHGLQDALVPVERAHQVVALLRHGNLVELEGVGHMPMMEASQATAEALRALV
jgi:pimeloyl-ACP methyl ester carboxylesterase